MKPLRFPLRGAVYNAKARGQRSLRRCSLALMFCASVGCDPAPDSKSKEESSKTPDSSEEPSKSATEKSVEELDNFARKFSKRYKKLNQFACEVESELCVASFKKAKADAVEMSFFLAFEKEDLKTSEQSKYLECFIDALSSSKSCVEDCEDANDDDDDDESTECSDSAMSKCVDGFVEDELDDCKLKKPSADKVFKTAMSMLHDRLNPSGGG